MLYDSIILLASGIVENPLRHDIRWSMDLDSHIRVDAVAKLYHEFAQPLVIVTGGRTNGPENPALSRILSYELTIKNRDVREEHLALEDISLDTSQNAEYTSRILRDRELLNPVLVTNGYHMERAKSLFRKYGFNLDGVIAEDVIKEFSDRHFRFVQEYKESDYVKERVKLHDRLKKVESLPFNLGIKLVRAATSRRGK